MASTPPPVSVVSSLKVFQGWWNGLTFGDGTDYNLEAALDGLLAYESRIADAPAPAGDGDIVFARFAASRFVVLPFAVTGPPLSPALDTKVFDLHRAFNADDRYREDWLVFRFASGARMWRARLVRRRTEVGPNTSKTGAVRVVVELKISDPHTYDAEGGDGGGAIKSIIVPTSLPSGGGFDVGPANPPTNTPSDLPLDITAGSIEGSGIAVNDGNAVAYPTLRIANLSTAPSPITETVVTNLTANIAATFTVTIAAGQTLVADFDAIVRSGAGPYVHIDGASRYSGWNHPRVPLPIRPGANTFLAEVTGGEPVVRLDWIDTTL